MVERAERVAHKQLHVGCHFRSDVAINIFIGRRERERERGRPAPALTGFSLPGTCYCFRPPQHSALLVLGLTQDLRFFFPPRFVVYERAFIFGFALDSHRILPKFDE